jgi:hypothetical protein
MAVSRCHAFVRRNLAATSGLGWCVPPAGGWWARGIGRLNASLADQGRGQQRLRRPPQSLDCRRRSRRSWARRPGWTQATDCVWREQHRLAAHEWGEIAPAHPRRPWPGPARLEGRVAVADAHARCEDGARVASALLTGQEFPWVATPARYRGHRNSAALMYADIRPKSQHPPDTEGIETVRS